MSYPHQLTQSSSTTAALLPPITSAMAVTDSCLPSCRRSVRRSCLASAFRRTPERTPSGLSQPRSTRLSAFPARLRLTVVNSLPQADPYRSTCLPSLFSGVSVASSLLRVQSQLTTRDLVLLGWLADHQLLTTFQIATALFPSLDYAQERLRTLYRLAVVDRFRPQRPDGGSYPYHYVLAQLGADVVAAQRGDDLPRRDRARRRREHLTSRANLPHLLGVNTFFTNLAGHARTHPHSDLVRWWSAATCQRIGAFAVDGDDIHVRTYTATSRPDGHGIYAEQGQQLLGISRNTAYRLASRGAFPLPLVRAGAQYRVPTAALIAVLHLQPTEPATTGRETT